MEDKYLKQTINNRSRSDSNASNASISSNISNLSNKAVDNILDIEKCNLQLIEITTLENIKLRKEKEELKTKINQLENIDDHEGLKIQINQKSNIELRNEIEELKIQINKYKVSRIIYILIIAIILFITVLFMYVILRSFNMFLSVHKYSRLNFGCNIYLYYTNHSIIY
jgi:DNA gyrase/topoisomerase IV subunit A